MEFKESQKFSQAWLWIILIITGMLTVGPLGAVIYRQIIQGRDFGVNPMGNKGIVVIFILVLVVFIMIFLLFALARLTTVIDSKGLTFRFFPFQIKHQSINWDDIVKYEVITYSPILDYGGWGVRSGKNGKAFNVAGNKGLLLFLKSGRPLLIGTQKDKELIDFLSKIR